MVGRLIQQQQLRAAHERARQIGAHAQPAGELAQGARQIGRFEAQARGQLRRAAARGITAETLVARVQARLQRAVIARARLRQLGRHRGELEVAVEDVVHQRRG